MSSTEVALIILIWNVYFSRPISVGILQNYILVGCTLPCPVRETTSLMSNMWLVLLTSAYGNLHLFHVASILALL